MPTLIERVSGYLVRIGAKKYGDPYTASAIVTDDGTVKGFAGKASLSAQRQAIRDVSRHLGLKLHWERYKKMAKAQKTKSKASREFDADIKMEYKDSVSKDVKARMHIEYFGMNQDQINKTESAVIESLLSLQE